MDRDSHDNASLDVLFVSELGMWPMDRGFRVHGCQLARALDAAGAAVGIASLRPTDAEVPAWLDKLLLPWPTAPATDVDAFLEGWDGRLARLRRRLAGHQAIDPYELAGIVGLVREHRPKVVVALGQHGAMMLRGLRAAAPDVTTVWYAADEPVLFHLSCLRRDPRPLWGSRLKLAALFAATENLFARGCDGAIGVSPLDTHALRWLGGARSTATIRNGVDLDYFAPDRSNTHRPPSVAFWGRMDFEPNVDAVTWFATHVWPSLAKRAPGAKLRIIGKNPTPAVKALRQFRGIEVTGEVDDIRPLARSATVTVLPMRCGMGIKNKLLEAAAMGRPIVASPRAVRGLDWPKALPPFAVCDGAEAWIEQVWHLWHDPVGRAQLCSDARAWAERHHDWAGAADQAVTYFNTLLGDGRKISLEPRHHTLATPFRDAAETQTLPPSRMAA